METLALIVFFTFLTAVFFASLVLIFLILVPMWKIFKKAGQPGWKALIPIYNSYIFVEIAGLPWWVFLGFFIPILNLVTVIVVMYHLSQRFGHGMGYGIGLTFLPFVFLPILGYGKSAYAAPVAQSEEKTEEKQGETAETATV